MDLIDNNLLPGETVTHRSQPHWIIFSMPITLLLLALVAFSLHSMLYIVGYVFVLTSALTGFLSYLSYTFTEYAITNKRLISRSGWISRRSSGVLLRKVESVDVHQAIWARLLGCGTVVITGTGGSRDLLPNIYTPFVFRQKLQASIAQMHHKE